MWDQMLKRWIDLVFWWWPSGGTAQQPPSGVAKGNGGRAPRRAASDGGTAKGQTPDDLTVIKGIGPAVQEKLRALGIKSFRDLASADPDKLTEQLKGRQPISKAKVRAWTTAARGQVAARD
jgi:predicted flap endonuclease-1-like 5' DNA nuclease